MLNQIQSQRLTLPSLPTLHQLFQVIFFSFTTPCSLVQTFLEHPLASCSRTPNLIFGFRRWKSRIPIKRISIPSISHKLPARVISHLPHNNTVSPQKFISDCPRHTTLKLQSSEAQITLKSASFHSLPRSQNRVGTKHYWLTSLLV